MSTISGSSIAPSEFRFATDHRFLDDAKREELDVTEGFDNSPDAEPFVSPTSHGSEAASDIFIACCNSFKNVGDSSPAS